MRAGGVEPTRGPGAGASVASSAPPRRQLRREGDASQCAHRLYEVPYA